MSSMPYVKFYSESFLTGVSGLTNEECGMYIKLLCLQHQSGHLDERTICLTCAIKSVSEIPYVMKKFEQDEDGLYFNSRMEVEIQKAEKYVESRIENGKNGGRPKKKDAENNPSKNHMDTIKEPYAEPYENHTDTYRALDYSSNSNTSITNECKNEVKNEHELDNTNDKQESGEKKKRKSNVKKPEAELSGDFDREGRVVNFVPYVDEFDLPPSVRESLVNFLSCRGDPKHKRYKEVPLRTLIKQVAIYAGKYGEEAVSNHIDVAVASEWVGMNFSIMDETASKSESLKNAGYQRKSIKQEDVVTADYFKQKAKELKKDE